MATSTFGSQAQTTFTSLGFSGSMAAADVATIAELILDDQVNTHPIWPGAFSQQGLLFIPNRGVLKMLPGDWVAVDTTGWPILVSSRAAGTTASWVHNP